MAHERTPSWLMDMDGVLVHEEQALPGAAEFVGRLTELGTPFLVRTNNSIYTRRDLAARLRASGLEVPEESIWTSALATARFLEDQRPGRHRVRDRRGGTDHRAARGRLLVRAHHERDPADRPRRALHRHQPRRHRSEPGRRAARDRLGGRADHARDGRRPLDTLA